MDNVLRWRGLRAKCSQCKKPFIKHKASNDPAYCSDVCARTAQPEHTAVGAFTTKQEK